MAIADYLTHSNQFRLLSISLIRVIDVAYQTSHPPIMITDQSLIFQSLNHRVTLHKISIYNCNDCERILREAVIHRNVRGIVEE
ncbi:MAG: hypothetical protein QXU32_00255 [Nitrososphaerales archaeon]